MEKRKNAMEPGTQSHTRELHSRRETDQSPQERV